MLRALVIWGVFFAVCAGSLFVYSLQSAGARPYEMVLHKRENEKIPTILFTGDIMLGRGVEDRIETHGVPWLFTHIAPYIVDADIAVGNFEATVPKKHVPTPDFTFAFSVRESYMTALSHVGFDVLSLANNHALDHGSRALTHTRRVCVEAGMICIGDPRSGHELRAHVATVHGIRVGIVPLYALSPLPEDGTLARLMDELSRVSDVQIVYVHWGDEYTAIPRDDDRALAHALIEFGADAIIGHHSHVIGKFEMYRGAPIFYSLGNLIFDQYFSSAVQEGVLLTLAIHDDRYEFTLTPYETYSVRSQPRILDAGGKERILRNLFGGDEGMTDTITTGILSLPR